MDTIVVDSSVIVKWLNQTSEENLKQADKLLQLAQDGELELLAPELAKYEIGNVLITKLINNTEAEIALQALYLLPITFITESIQIAHQTFFLAHSLRITYYDASFLSLAKLYSATLVTENIKHQGKSTDVKIVSLKDY